MRFTSRPETPSPCSAPLAASGAAVSALARCTDGTGCTSVLLVVYHRPGDNKYGVKPKKNVSTCMYFEAFLGTGYSSRERLPIPDTLYLSCAEPYLLLADTIGTGYNSLSDYSSCALITCVFKCAYIWPSI